MVNVGTEKKILSYLGEGDLAHDTIRDTLQKDERVVVWGYSNGLREDSSFQEMIQTALEGLNNAMEWRKRFGFSKRPDPIRNVLGEQANDFYQVFDDLRKKKVAIIAAGPRVIHPFLYFIDEMNFVAAMAAPDAQTIYYGYGLLETWRT